MNTSNFISTLQQPQAVTKSQTEDLKVLIEAFPFCQSARALYLKGLKNSESFKYNQQLKTTAAYTTDRSVLFDFITSESFLQNEISQHIKQNTTHIKDIEVRIEDISISKGRREDAVLDKQLDDTYGVLDPELFQPKLEAHQVAHFDDKDPEPTEAASEDNIKKPTAPQDILNIGKPLNFNPSETHSFNEWLSLTSFKPIQRAAPEKIETEAKPQEGTSDTKALSRAKKFELIEQFITKNPKLDPVDPLASKFNIAKAQMIQPEALMTETLARIYVEQKNYKKAIQSYKILSLKYPEKSGFFADQIKAVKQLQEQNNKE